MIMLSKPKLVSASLLALLLLLPSFSLVHGIGEHLNLPNNTVLYDDFEGNSKWFSNDSCTPGKQQVNSTAGTWIYDGTASLEINCGQTSNTQDARRTFWYPGDIVGFAGYISFSCNMRVASGPTFGISLEYWDANNHRIEAKIQFVVTSTGTTARWQYGHDVGLTDTFEEQGVTGLQKSLLYYGYDSKANAFCSGGAVRAANGWFPFKIVANRATGQYVSITVPEGTYSCTGTSGIGGTKLPNGCNVKDDGADTIFTTGFASNAWGIEVQVDVASAAPTNPPAYRVFLDNVLVTDETPGNPNIIQFGIVTASGLFYLIMVTTAIMYSASGFGTVMRVFSHGKGPKFLINPKVIIISGVVGTMGFLFMLIVGANLVKPACPTGFVCVG